jgi:outer membrane usher protein FimD/PapC
MKTQGRYCPVALALMAALWPQAGWSESYFNPAFLSDDTASVADLSRFEQGHQQAPGVYRVDIWRNDEFIGTQDVRFEQAENTPPVAGGLSPCITRAMLDRFGVNVAAFPNWLTCRASLRSVDHGHSRQRNGIQLCLTASERQPAAGGDAKQRPGLHSA